MRRRIWILIPLVLFGAAALGYVVRGARTKTTTTTVVEIQTVAPPPPATQELTATVVRSRPPSH